MTDFILWVLFAWCTGLTFYCIHLRDALKVCLGIFRAMNREIIKLKVGHKL